MLRNKRRIAPFVMAFSLILAAPAMAADAGQHGSPLVVAHNMVIAWNQLDVDRIVNTFSEDAVFQSMMLEPIVGRAALTEHFSKLLENATHLELQLRNVAVSGNTVFLERVDVFTVNGKHGSVPVVAVMDIEDGKVARWREYYDRADLLEEMGVSSH
jgi:uncharacterized protein (TIGR02246 family)